MTYNKDTFSDKLIEWGKSCHIVPPKNDSIKQTVLQSVHAQQGQANKTTRKSRFWIFPSIIITASTFALFCLFIKSQLITATSTVAESGSAVTRGTAHQAGYSPGPGTSNLGISYGAATGLGSTEKNLVEKIMDSVQTEKVELDTREYLDTSYYATINTRDVKKLSDQTKTIIRGHFGRIDSISEQPKFARISFSLPKTELDRMILELKDLAPEKMYLETIYADNRLSEKQNIETDTGNAVDELSRLQTERATTVASYDKQLDAAQSRINSLARSLNANYTLRAATTNTVKLAEINAEINRLAENRASAEQDYRNIKSRENKELTIIDKNIDRQNTQLNNLGQKDDKLMTDVETVTGSITIRWVSYLTILNTYIPIRPVLILSIIASAIYLIFRRRPRPLNIPY
jgi:hypothetical protein